MKFQCPVADCDFVGTHNQVDFHQTAAHFEGEGVIPLELIAGDPNKPPHDHLEHLDREMACKVCGARYVVKGESNGN